MKNVACPLFQSMLVAWLLGAAPLNASDTPAPEFQIDSVQDASSGGCSACDARKQQQVKARLEKKQQQEQAGQVDPDQSSQSTVNGSD